MIRTSPASNLLAVTLATGFLVSCTRPEDPGITEKIALLEAELRDREAQLATLQEEESSQSASPAEPAASAPDLDKARSSYLAFVEDLRQKLVQAMPAAKFDRTSVFPVEGPDPSKPIISRVAFRIAGADSRSGEMVIPLFADPAGRWLEPPTAEIIANFRSKASAPPVAAPQTIPQPAPVAPTTPKDVMGAGQTHKVDWGDSQKSGQPPRNAASPVAVPDPKELTSPPSPSQAPPQPAPAQPKKVMPASREVIIDFE